MGASGGTFAERARFEAERYGSDRWVFVRELLQNARDAGAREVHLRATVAEGRERLSCRDDGDGMTLDHARQFLFRLYASSKAGHAEYAGRFGIGFWSVLRFEPDLIVVRSRPADGDGWEVRVDETLATAGESPLVMQAGTEVVLERPARREPMAARVVEAIRVDAPLLRRRGEPSEPVRVFVNGEPVHGERELPRPNLSFAAPGLRGTVALADEPRVEVFAHGLRVRRAAFLSELLLGDAAAPPASNQLPEGLLPRVALDSDRLRVLMARGNARDDATLRQMVALARDELDRLVRAELDLAAPVGLAERWRERLGTFLRRHRRRVGAAAAIVATAAAVALALLRWPAPREAPLPASQPPQPAVTAAVAPATPFRDLGARYRGPSIDPLAAGPAIDLRYRPDDASPLFAALRITGLAEDGSPLAAPLPAPLPPADGPPCAADCLEVELAIAAAPGVLRLPVAVGHEIDPASVQLDGLPMGLRETPAGEPALWLEAATVGVLRYRSGLAEAVPPAVRTSWPVLPSELAEALPTLELLPAASRMAAAEEIVRALVSFDRSEAIGARLREARRAGAPLFEAAVAAGGGDCDVQNSLLAALLERSGLPARLAIGPVGSGGRARAGLHAWVEVLIDGRWQVADASTAIESAESAEPAGGGPEVAPRIAVGQEAVATPVREPAHPGDERSWGSDAAMLGAVAGTGLMLSVAGLLWYIRQRSRRTTRSLDADGAVDLARLLGGALARPEAFGEAAALFDRPLVPLIGDRRLSLRGAQKAVRRGLLFRSEGGTALARRAAGSGELVVDASTSAGRAVADGLGARDLDDWDGVAECLEAPPAAARAEAELRRLGGRWRIRVADGGPAPVAVVEARMLGLDRGSWVAVIDGSSAPWRSVEAAADARPAWASLAVAEIVVDALDLEPRQRRRWLAALAREAISERAGVMP